MEEKKLTNQKSQKDLKASWGDQMENLPVQTSPSEKKKLKRTKSMSNLKKKIRDEGKYVLCVDTIKNRLWLTDKMYIDILTVAKEQKILRAREEYRDLRFRRELGYQDMNAYLSASHTYYTPNQDEIKVTVNQTPEPKHSDRLTFIEIFIEETDTYVMFSIDFVKVEHTKTRGEKTTKIQYWEASNLLKLTSWPKKLTTHRKLN